MRSQAHRIWVYVCALIIHFIRRLRIISHGRESKQASQRHSLITANIHYTLYTLHNTLYSAALSLSIYIRRLDLASVRNQIIRHRLVQVVLREAGVESHDSLELLVLADGDVDGRLDDEPSDCF